jgi:hypothetical protein
MITKKKLLQMEDAFYLRTGKKRPTAPYRIVALRGGEDGGNEVGAFDDLFCLIGTDGTFEVINGNTDPSRIGFNQAIGKDFALLAEGIHDFIIGPHKGRMPALRQPTRDEAERFGIPANGYFTVWRPKTMAALKNRTAKQEFGYYAINFHDNGNGTGTSSWGCLTALKAIFVPWMNKVHACMKSIKQKYISVVLIEV